MEWKMTYNLLIGIFCLMMAILNSSRYLTLAFIVGTLGFVNVFLWLASLYPFTLGKSRKETGGKNGN